MIDKSAPDNSQPAPGSSVPTVRVSPDAIPAMGELFLRLEQILTAERLGDPQVWRLVFTVVSAFTIGWVTPRTKE